MGVTLKELHDFIIQVQKGNDKAWTLGDKNPIVNHVSSLEEGDAYSLTYCKDLDYDFSRTKASVIIVPKINIEKLYKYDKNFIVVDNPRLRFAQCLQEFFEIPKPKIEIDPSAKLDKGVVLGGDGFGFERDEYGELVKFPHIGGIIIKSNVEVGANTCIDRGTIGDTIIDEGSKIDNLCHIAHNDYVGKHVMIIAGAKLGGSVNVGDYSTIYPNSYVFPQMKLGKYVNVGAGSVVRSPVKIKSKNGFVMLSHVPDYKTVVGSPAIDIELIRKDNK